MLEVTVHMLKSKNHDSTRTSECGLVSYVLVTTPKWSLVTCGQCKEQQPVCSYCSEPVDEDNDRVWFTTATQMDHYDCVPLSEKSDPGDY